MKRKEERTGKHQPLTSPERAYIQQFTWHTNVLQAKKANSSYVVNFFRCFPHGITSSCFSNSHSLDFKPQCLFNIQNVFRSLLGQLVSIAVCRLKWRKFGGSSYVFFLFFIFTMLATKPKKLEILNIKLIKINIQISFKSIIAHNILLIYLK